MPHTAAVCGTGRSASTGPGAEPMGERRLVQIVKDQYDQLHADSEHSGRVLALALHPFVIGQPFRHRYLDEALEYLATRPDVWLTTSDEIADHYRRSPAARG
ncbi:polysaccharide deacetylase family protein [Marinitenerispora sediminis]|uniref:hypothetical protein n=1 Tax=Marinitenerispora sediminis TaxID=1931232 RepID=UPI0018F27264|nr:hypothetical protein [Marinitenerispora sediminis]